ncbi:MAG: hypothetical protein IPG53_10195 [Ignavibacteriales bacterium]|nr:hypothetical protein [Ignavibacteriales bacterium]
MFSRDAQENLLAQSEIMSNLDTILFLIKKLPDFDAEKVIYRLIIQLYHRSLESFCRGSKSDEEIYSDSKANKKKVETLTNRKAMGVWRKSICTPDHSIILIGILFEVWLQGK